MNTRLCSACKQEFPLTLEYFQKSTQNYSGFKHMCRNCNREYDRQYRANNKASIKAVQTDWRKRNPEKQQGIRKRGLEAAKRSRLDNLESERAKDREYSREWRKKHPGHKTGSTGQWEKKNPDKVRKVKSDWKKRNPEYVVLERQKRRHRERELPFDFTRQDWDRAVEYFNGCCAVCGRQLKDLFGTHTAAIDHWIPVASPECPGAIVTNCVPLCAGLGGCNNSKGAKEAGIWLTEKFGKREAAMILKKIAAYFEYVKTIPR